MTGYSARFADLTDTQRMKFVKGSVIPRPIAWITTRNATGTHNLAPFSYFTMLSSTLLSVSFMRTGTGLKDTARNLLREGHGVVHIAGRALTELLDRSSAEVPPDDSEVDRLGLELVPSLTVETRGLKIAKIRLEVTVDRHIELPHADTGQTEADLILLRVTAVHFADDVFDPKTEYVLHEALDPLARLGGPYFAGSVPTDYTRRF